ncbi:NAD-dependent epimerase/dehydratase family protein [Alloiococcus sp. CFN-8]|uniref:NAD-dependent epimerase/dehydratase family protein n=1 Tax=Alloiococcus sp. CFN-8 TaxID=3416081 RepID=UPI003CF3552C
MDILERIRLEMVEPSDKLVEDIKRIKGDIMILGVSGKMGVNLAILAKKAAVKAGLDKKIYGVARFSEGSKGKEELEEAGVETIVCDFLVEEQINRLPQVENIIFMIGYKFGTVGNEAYSWAVNTYLPGRVAEHFKSSRIVAFSTGCVYPLVPLTHGAPTELVPADPLGEYAQSCLGRERIFQYFSMKNQTPVTLFRLNYAIDLKYGVISELAKSILKGEAIDLTMGYVNVIWQPDACEVAIRSLLIAEAPANILNVTGPETLSVKWIAEELGRELGIEPSFRGTPQETALLSNASKAHELFGYPRTTIREMIKITALWLTSGGETINKPTHFQEREGKY